MGILIAVAIILMLLILSMPRISFNEGYRILERGGSYHSLDAISSLEGNVKADSAFLYAEKIGGYDMHYTVKRAFFSKEYTFHYEVVDTIPPVLTVKDDTVSVFVDMPYSYENVLNNVSTNEGTLEYDTDLDNLFPGEYTVNVRAVDEAGNSSSVSYRVRVPDEEAPFVLDGGYGIEILRGSDFDIREYISYGDNADPDPELIVEGKVNPSKIGKYPLHLSLKDASGNETKWDTSIEVIRKRKEEEDDQEEEPVEFSDFRKDQAGQGRRFGVDVSEWQGDIDFAKLKDAGCDFIMMRIGFSRNGTLYLDKSFRANLAGAKSVGMPIGIYYYSNDKSEEEVRSVFRQIVSELGDTQLELPVVFDWENFGDFQEYGISFKDLDHLYQVFAQEAVKRGYEPMLYGSKYYLENIWRYREERNIWLAHYTDKSSYQGNYRLWQVCAWGRIDGIEGNVDLDVLFY